MHSLASLRIKIFADGADLPSMQALNADPLIKGLTTNPTLMRKAGITDYLAFARSALAFITTKPLSLEVFSDDFPTMDAQARRLAALSPNVYVKIPITNSHGRSSLDLIRNLALDGIKVNVTAILTLPQVRALTLALESQTPAIVSVFAGRIADTSIDPIPLIRQAKLLLEPTNAELLWASTREPLNITQADRAGADIITVPPDILAKAVALHHYDLPRLSLETVQMFARDAASAGYTL